MISLVWAWQIERPSGSIDIEERVENAYTDGNASVGIGVAIDDYRERVSEYGSADVIALNVSMTANSRMGIQYSMDWQDLLWISENELWYRNDMVNVGDDEIFWVSFPYESTYPFYFRFYGGLGSAEYKGVWICTNGFIVFDNNSISASPNPCDIPYSGKPNAMIAALWTDLVIDSQAAIITGQYVVFSHYYFVIIWKNALHKASGKRLTFEIILEEAPQYYPADRRYSQSYIYVSYKDVSSINTDFTFGIEDQQGSKGLGGLCSGTSLQSYDDSTIWFYQSSNSYFLKYLTITIRDNNPNTKVNILNEAEPDRIRGYNVRLKYDPLPEPDGTYMFANALAGTATLLISAFSPGGWVAAACFIVDTVLVGLDWVDWLAYYQYSNVEVSELQDWSQEVYIKVPTYDYVVDASLSMVAHWVLYTPNEEGEHLLTITATLEYYEYSIYTGEIIEKDPVTTSVYLKIGPDDNNSFDTADEISVGWHFKLYIGGYDTDDYYKIYVNEGYELYVYLKEENSDTDIANINLYLYDPERTEKANKTLMPPPYSASLSFIADSSGWWFIRIELLAGGTFYSLYVSVRDPNSGGGCPYIYTWNGNQFIIGNNILPSCEASNGADVEDYYKLEQKLAPLYEGEFLSLYSLQIREFEHEHTYLDTIKLFAVDHDPDVNVGVTPDGQILTYEDPVPPISAINSQGENVLTPLYLTDNNYYQGFKGDYLILDFGEINLENVDAKLILRTDRPPLKKSIHIQILDSSGQWKEIATIIPRTYWATDIINLSNYLPNSKTELKIRLYFTASHKIDFIGLDISKQADIKTYEAHLILAKHSSEGLITSKLLKNDNIYAELKPEEQITLLFTTYKQPPSKERTFIIYAEGHYYTIKN